MQAHREEEVKEFSVFGFVVSVLLMQSAECSVQSALGEF